MTGIQNSDAAYATGRQPYEVAWYPGAARHPGMPGIRVMPRYTGMSRYHPPMAFAFQHNMASTANATPSFYHGIPATHTASSPQTPPAGVSVVPATATQPVVQPATAPSGQPTSRFSPLLAEEQAAFESAKQPDPQGSPAVPHTPEVTVVPSSGSQHIPSEQQDEAAGPPKSEHFDHNPNQGRKGRRTQRGIHRVDAYHQTQSAMEATLELLQQSTTLPTKSELQAMIEELNGRQPIPGENGKEEAVKNRALAHSLQWIVDNYTLIESIKNENPGNITLTQVQRDDMMNVVRNGLEEDGVSWV